MKGNKVVKIVGLSLIGLLLLFFGLYIYGNWEISVNEANIEDIASRHMTEVYSYDYIVEGVYINHFIDDSYRDHFEHEFIMSERATCIFGSDEDGNNILLIKTWRVFSRNFVVELDDYYNYSDSIAYIKAAYPSISDDDISMVLTMDDSILNSNITTYVAFLVDHGDNYSRFIFYDGQVVEAQGRFGW